MYAYGLLDYSYVGNRLFDTENESSLYIKILKIMCLLKCGH